MDLAVSPKQEPLVTIVIPTIGSRDLFFRQALVSALAQDYRPLEILVSDNGSESDQVGRVVDECNDSRLVFRRNDRRVPALTHWNQCWAAARGRHVLVLQDDDYVSSNYVSELMSLCASALGVTVALGRTINVGTAGELLGSLSPQARSIVHGPTFAVDHLLARNGRCCSPGSMLADRSYILDIGGFPETSSGLFTDGPVLALLAARGTVAYSPKAEYYSRWHSSNFTGGMQGAEAVHAAMGLVAFVQHVLRSNAYNNLSSGDRQAIVNASQVAAIGCLLGPMLRALRRGKLVAARHIATALMAHRPDWVVWAARALWWYTTGRCWTDVHGSPWKWVKHYLAGTAVPWAAVDLR